MAENIPCNILPIIYGFIEISLLEIILNTCNNIEIPPNPNRKEDKIILIEISLQAIELICLTPFVTSIIPDKKLLAKALLLIPNKLKTGSSKEDVILIILLFSRIDNTTLKRTTKPPIINIVLVADRIELLNTSPKLENETLEELIGAGFVPSFL